MQPAWFPLPPAQQDHMVKVLQFWEKRTSKIKTYHCKFRRWKYDPVFLPPAPGKEPQPIEYSEGEIKYAVPDKAMYKDTLTKVYDVAKKSYKDLPDGGHHWICDGENIIEMVPASKQMVKTELPEAMRGKALRTNGPLPFLFGAKAKEIMARYWVRTLPPREGQQEFHLEAYPKHQEDAANFQKVEIFLDGKKHLPSNMIVYNVNWSPQNPAKTSYQFLDAKENPINILNLAPWRKDFFEPTLPKGWQIVKVQQNTPPPARLGNQPQAANNAATPRSSR